MQHSTHVVTATMDKVPAGVAVTGDIAKYQPIRVDDDAHRVAIEAPFITARQAIPLAVAVDIQDQHWLFVVAVPDQVLNALIECTEQRVAFL
ncbi:hypothetical protein AO284_29140 [Pseudomonas sp. NZIPFR-PS2]|nr:hypothetical protein AO284_29140 [Pseudomonas sp. NZIPFR-PS2]